MKAVCTWGDGPPVLLCLNGSKMVLIEKPSELDKWQNGTVCEANCGLTVEEARRLADELLMVAYQVEELELQCKDHDELMGCTSSIDDKNEGETPLD